MKRTLESWGTLEKFILASHIPHSGDPNWGNVSAKTKNVFDDISSYISDEKKPSEWFNEKQCLIQFENLLKSVPKKKRRLEKGIDPTDNLHESLVQSLKQEFVAELTKKMAEDQALYLKMLKERDDILSGRLDHKLEDMMGSIEAKEREKEIKMKLKFKIGEKNSDVEVKKEETRINESPTHTEPPKTNVTTSPLLTSLLQSPSPLTRPSIPSSASPTISLLLNSSPSVPTKDSPTLTKLLESSTPISLPQPSTSSSLLQSPIKTPEKKIEPPVPTPEETVTAAVEEVVAEVENTIKMEEEIESQNVVEDIIESVLESEIIIEEEPKEIEIKKEEKLIEVVPTEGAEEEVMVTVEQIIEKVEEAIIETVGPSSNETCELDLNQTAESEAIEENLDCLELDHDAVELIVMGPNQGPVITVRHDTSSETNNEDSSKSEDIKQETVVSEIATVSEESVLDDPKSIKEEEKEEVVLQEEEKEVEVIEEVAEESSEKEIEEVKSERGPSPGTESLKLEIEEEDSKSSDSTMKDVKEEEEDEEEKSEEVAPAKIELNSPFELTDTTSNDISEPKSVISSNEDEKTSNDDSQSQPESIPQKETRQSKKQRSQSLETVKEEEEFKASKSDDRTKSFIENLPSTPDSREGKEENEKRRSTRKRTSITLSDSKPSSPSPSTVSNDDDRDYKLWKKSILLVYNRLAAHKFASVFLKPITENEASGYHSVILKPTDLTKIKRNIENGSIRTTAHFQREMLIMVQNAVMYNKTDTQVHKMAQTMLDDMVAQMEIMVQALGDGVSLRRSYEQKTVTRGRASKVAPEDTPRRKRASTVEDQPRPKRKRSDMN